MTTVGRSHWGGPGDGIDLTSALDHPGSEDPGAFMHHLPSIAGEDHSTGHELCGLLAHL